MKMTRFLLERFIHNAGQLWKYVKGVPLFDLIKGIRIGYLFGQNGITSLKRSEGANIIVVQFLIPGISLLP